MVEDKTKFLRQVAVKMLIGDIFRAEFVQEKDENKLNHLLTIKNEKIYRVNLIAVVVNKEKIGSITNLLVDDGTSELIVRSFEEDKYVEELGVGDVLLVIGRVRMYNNEKYLAPEIIKKTDPVWLKVRSLELQSGKSQLLVENIEKNKDIEIVQKGKKKELVEEIEKNEEIKKIIKNEVIDIDEDVEEDLSLSLLPAEKIIKLIKKLDQGEGVLIEDILEKSDLKETELLLEKMMESGDIFQNQPGRVKVL